MCANTVGVLQPTETCKKKPKNLSYSALLVLLPISMVTFFTSFKPSLPLEAQLPFQKNIGNLATFFNNLKVNY